MPKLPSTIQIAGHLAQEYIDHKIRETREGDEIEELNEENSFETLYRNLGNRSRELKYEIDTGTEYAEEDDPGQEAPEGKEPKKLSEEEIEKRKELQEILDELRDETDRTLRNLRPLAMSAHTGKSRVTVVDQRGNRQVMEYGMNHGEYEPAQKALHETANDLKPVKKALDRLQHDFPEELEKPYMKDFIEGLNAQKVENGRGILKNCGATKTAYEWIEQSKEKLNSKDFLDELDAAKHIARIVAARQLTNARAKETDSLKRHSFSEGELDARAYQLLEDPSFATYLMTIGVSEVADYGIDDTRNEFAFNNQPGNDKPYLKFFGSNDHGGKLEADMMKYYSKRADAAELDQGLFGRYLRAPEQEKYSTYQEYIVQNSRVDGLQNLEIGAKDPEEKEFDLHDAARMAAAYKLSQSAHKTFSERRLENQAKNFEKDPAFRLICRDESAMHQLKNGKPADFFDTFNGYKNRFVPPEENVSLKVTEGDVTIKEYAVSANEMSQEAMKKLYRKLLGPSDNYKEQEEYVKKGSKKYQQMVAAVKNFVEKSPENLTAEDRLKVFAATVHYQEGREKRRFWLSGRDRFDLSMEIAKTAVSGTRAQNEFDKQVDHVNELRGEPGFLQSDTRMRKESVRDYVEEEKNETLRKRSQEDSEEITNKLRSMHENAAEGFEIIP